MNASDLAFPLSYAHAANEGRRFIANGITKRDLFAAFALAGIAANRDIQHSPKEDSAYAYQYADAMLYARGRDS